MKEFIALSSSDVVFIMLINVKMPLFASKHILSVMLGNYLQQTTSADDIFRCIFFLAL